MATMHYGGGQMSRDRNDVPSVHLTRREAQILTLLFEGNASQVVADRLEISKRTVDFHLDNIYHKLDVTNRAQACFEAARRGLITFAPMQTTH